MKSRIPAELRRLAEIFPCKLYAVGGFVRDTLLGYPNHDIDLAGCASPERVINALKGSKFSVAVGSKKLFTLIIKGENSYEYTSFRVDNYSVGHRPDNVKRTRSIKLDASRRDFTVNALYYDIKNDKVLDFFNGLTHLKDKMIVTPRDPNLVFAEDGLRLMRLARFASALNFAISEETMLGAKNNAHLIKDISPERIRDELDRILVGDLAYGAKSAQYRGIDMLYEMGVLDIILPEIAIGHGMMQRPDYHLYDVYTHTLMAVYYSDPSIRLAALMHDVAKPYCMRTNGKYSGHDKEGERLTKEILTRLRYPKKTIERVSRLVGIHMFNLKYDCSTTTIRRFIIKNQDILKEYALLNEADHKAHGTKRNLPLSSEAVMKEYEKMKEEKVPFSVSELLVTGDDIVKMSNIPETKRGVALNKLLLDACLENSNLLTREKQLEYLRNLKGE